MIKTKLLIISLISATSILRAQESFSLTEAIDYALKNNKKSINADYEIEKANQKVKETRAIGLPQVNAEGNFNHFLDIATTVAPAQAFNPLAPDDAIVELQFGTEFNTSASLTVSQLLFDGSYFVGLQTSRKFKSVSQLQKKKTELEIKEGVTKAYYNVLVAKESIKVLEELLVTNQDLVTKTQVLFDEGVTDEDNLDQLKLGVLNIKNSIAASNKRLELAETMLKYEMGMSLASSIETTSELNDIVQSVSVSDISSNEISNNIDFQLIETQIELQELNVKYEKSRSLPSLGAFFNHQQSAFRNEFDFFENKPWYPTTLWGLKLSIPIWSSGQQAALVNQAKLDLKQTENQLNMLEDGLQLQLTNAKTNFQNAIDAYELQKEAIETSKKIYDRHQIKYNEGVISSMELTQTQNQYINAQSSFISAMYEVVNARIELDKITNKL